MSLEEELPPQDDKWPLDTNAVDDGLKARYKPPANAKAARLAKPYALEYIHCPLAPDGSVPTDGLNEDGGLFRLIDQLLQHYESGGRGRSAKGTVILGQGEVADVLVDDAPEWGGGGSSGGGSGGGFKPAKDATNAAATLPSTPPIIYVHGGNGRGALVSACLLSLFNPTLSASEVLLQCGEQMSQGQRQLVSAFVASARMWQRSPRSPGSMGPMYGRV